MESKLFVFQEQFMILTRGVLGFFRGGWGLADFQKNCKDRVLTKISASYELF